MDIRKGRHCVFNLHAHIVFVTKYRGKVFTSKHLAFIKDVCENICLSFETTLVEFEGEDNHVHLLINYPPKIALSKLVNSLKGVSSRHLKKEFPELKKSIGKELYGHHHILLEVVEEHLLVLLNNILNSKIDHYKNKKDEDSFSSPT